MKSVEKCPSSIDEEDENDWGDDDGARDEINATRSGRQMIPKNFFWDCRLNSELCFSDGS